MAIGWRVEDVAVTGNEAEPRVHRKWYPPRSRRPARVPMYTSELESAYDLAREVAPGNAGGVSWQEGKGGAKVGDSPFVQAATGPIALCLAALLHLKGSD